MDNVPKQHIFKRPSDPAGAAAAFEGDLFDRAAMAERLTGYLSRLPDGAVIAIDAPWGEGKTWFGRHWRASLQACGYRTAYIDCFQRDHIDDPFLMIAAELLALAKASHSSRGAELLDASKRIGAKLLPAAAKLAAGAAGHWISGNAELGEDIAKAIGRAGDAASDSIEKMVAKRLEDYESDKRSVDGFKKTLTELAAERDTPVVIFVDELDRCRPDFAVRTIERAKHFFEAPGVVFVLLLNRSQLAAAVEGLYGPRIDSYAYLGKFIQLSLGLPKRLSAGPHGLDDNRTYCAKSLELHGFAATHGAKQFAEAMGVLATIFGLSLRDIEQAVALYSLAQPIDFSSAYIAWPIALKLARPDLFRRVLGNEMAAHAEARQELARAKDRAGGEDWALDPFEDLHACAEGGFKKEPETGPAENLLRRMNLRPRDLLRMLFGRIDLAVD